MQFSWNLFQHYLLSRRAGSLIRIVAWLCMSGVAIGVVSLVVVMSVMNGFNASIRKRLFAAEPHLIVRLANQSSKPAQSAAEIESSQVLRDLRARPGIRADVYESQDVILRTADGSFGGALARGVSKGSLEYLLTESQKANHIAMAGLEDFTPPLRSETYDLNEGEVFMGVDLARGLGIFEGDTITIVAPEALLLPSGEAPPFAKVKVKGLVSTNISDIDSKTIFYAQGKTLNGFYHSSARETGIEVRLPNPENYQDTASWLRSSGAQVETWADRNSTLFYALKLEKLAIGTFLGLSALIASFSIVTVLYLLMTQKQKDIGLLMSLGLSSDKTRNLFIRVGLLLAAIGIFSGLIIGVLLCVLIDENPLPILPDIYVDATIPAKLDWRFLLGIVAASSVVAVVSAWIPARRLTGQTPADALRSQRRTHGARL